MKTARIARSLLRAALVSLCLIAAGALAAEPPDLLNYQGVLRGADGAPLDGAHDMEFRFMSAEVGGDEILIDAHDAAHANPVNVRDGLFNVELGGGAVSDGSGPGLYKNLAVVFRDYDAVWLEIEVGVETLAPRLRILAAAYALNADYLDGLNSSQVLRSDTSDTFSSGTLTIGVGATLDSAGTLQAARIYDRNDIGYYLDPASESHLAELHVGSLYDGDSSTYWLDPSADPSGRLFGDLFIGYGSGSDDDYLYFDVGAESLRWDNANTRFALTDAVAMSGPLQVGSIAGAALGYNLFGTGTPESGDMGNTGDLFASNDVEVGGELYLSGTLYVEGAATPSDGDQYIYFTQGGSRQGAHLMFEDSYGRFELSSGLHIASSASGVYAAGANHGAQFEDANDSGIATLGINDDGIQANGQRSGGYFRDSNDDGRAYVGYGDRGIWAKGTFAGGTFSHINDVTHWADVSTPTHKIVGTGAVSFTQNHPYDPNLVVVYAAPEGDEVAVYTRGSAHLSAGEARVPLGETFAWVTNPDIGLTAQVTPLGDCLGLYVESVTPTELVVREASGGGSDVAFDYVVHGLRIGFEEMSPVQPKRREAPLPEPDAVRSSREGRPELAAYSALERFRAMTVDVWGEAAGALDLGGSRELREAIETAGSQRIGWTDPDALDPDLAPVRGVGSRRDESATLAGAPAAPDVASAPVRPATGSDNREDVGMAVGEADADLLDERDPLRVFPVSAEAKAGDVLVLDPLNAGYLRPADVTASPDVVGIAAADPEMTAGRLEVEVVDSLFALVKVDASYGAILAGDLLISSPTPGHAMGTLAATPGTVVGKALEPLESGTGVIRVLVMAR